MSALPAAPRTNPVLLAPGLTLMRLVPRPSMRFVIPDVAPCATETRATIDPTPMMTPSIVSTARILDGGEARQGERDELERVHAATLPVLDVDAPLGRDRHVAVVGDQDDGGAGALSSCEEREHVRARLRVEVAGGLVREQDRGLGDERPRDRDPLLLAAGELGRLVVHPVAEAEPLERLAGARVALGRAARPRRAAASPRSRAPSSAAAG